MIEQITNKTQVYKDRNEHFMSISTHGINPKSLKLGRWKKFPKTENHETFWAREIQMINDDGKTIEFVLFSDINPKGE